MRTLVSLCLTLGVAALLALPGCGKEEPAKAPAPGARPAPAPAPAPDPAAKAAALLADFQTALAAGKLDEAEAALKQLEALQATLPAADAAKVTAARAALDAARKPAVPPAPPVVPIPPAATVPAPAADAQQKALTLLDQIKQYILEKKWDLAEGAFKQLEAIKDQLPAALQQKIKDTRTAFDVAKLGAGGLPFK